MYIPYIIIILIILLIISFGAKSIFDFLKKETRIGKNSDSIIKRHISKGVEMISTIIVLLFFTPIPYAILLYLLFTCPGITLNSCENDGGRFIWWIGFFSFSIGIIAIFRWAARHIANSEIPISNGEANHELDPKKLIDLVKRCPVSHIESIRFLENGGKAYVIKLDSIKKIAKYIEFKYKKTSFVPNELLLERDFFIENYGSNLSKENYNLVVGTLSSWIEHGGSFDIILKK